VSDVIDASGFYRKGVRSATPGGQTSEQSANNRKRRLERANQEHPPDSSSSRRRPLPTTTTAGTASGQSRTDRPELRAGSVNRRRQQPPDFDQRRFTFREDFTLLDLKGAGITSSSSAYITVNNYNVHKFRTTIPNSTPHLDQPGLRFPTGLFGSGIRTSRRTTTSTASTSDDWTVNPRLTVNLGIRWTTRPTSSQQLRDAGQRHKANSPGRCRLIHLLTDRSARATRTRPASGGFSYDLSGKGTTVLFGGYGRYSTATLQLHS
jgi:hypothetical protein